MGYNVAVDGPAGAGKSTIAKLVAKEKNYIYVDTGAMYRAMAIHFLGKGIAPENVADVAGACQDADVTIDYEDGIQQVYLNGENVTDRLRTEEVATWLRRPRRFRPCGKNCWNCSGDWRGRRTSSWTGATSGHAFCRMPT